MATSEIFQKLYSGLNPEQKRAVDTIEGPVMVIAGPGTGKTQILALRIANILLKTDTAPSSILALTFTEAGSEAMRKRLLDIVGPRAYEIEITTFHGFSNKIIGRFPDAFPGIIGREAAVQIDQIEIVQEILKKGDYSALRPYGDPEYYIRPVQQKISELKRDNISPKEYGEMVARAREEAEAAPERVHVKGAHKGKVKGVYLDLEKRIVRAEELVRLYGEYQEALGERGRYDYDDMIMEVVRALKSDPDLLLQLQEEYQYVLADEHQDANRAQNQILELLVNFHESPNLFIVGDEKQAIFRFQGASLEHFHYFKKLYPEAELITLRHNYRSTQTILDAAAEILRSDLAAQSVAPQKPISVRIFSRPDYEMRAMAEDIAVRLGETPENSPTVAVLYRANKDSHAVVEALEQAGVPFVIESDQEITGDIEIRKLILFLRAIDGYPDEKLFAEALHLNFLSRDEFEIYRAIALARKERKSLYEILHADRLAQQMKGWHKESLNLPLAQFFAFIVRESGFLGHLLAHRDGRIKLQKLEAFFDEVRSLGEAHHDYFLKDFLRYLDLLAEHGGSLARPLSRAGSGVRLMTAHKSKGLEFDLVYIVNATESSWSKRSRGSLFDLRLEPPSDDLSDDDRRLFYVALTRAKREAIISYSEKSIDGKEQFPTRFVASLAVPLVAHEPTTMLEEKYVAHPEEQFRARKSTGHPIKDSAFLRELFDAQGLSVTSLGNYLECPWLYFYRNLLRIPEAPSKHQMFGTAVHAALKRLFDSFVDGDPMSKRALVDSFIKNLDREPLSPKDYDESLLKGKKALPGYYDTYISSWRRTVLSEYAINGVLLDDIKLVGKLDKIEILDNGTDVNVVDYKTGKPKSEREIEAAGYRRQLAFYHLLLDRYENGRFKMVSGEIDFVEPDPKGRYFKKMIVIDKKETLELEATVRRIAEEIRTLAFWDKECDDEECEYCDLRKMMN